MPFGAPRSARKRWLLRPGHRLRSWGPHAPAVPPPAPPCASTSAAGASSPAAPRRGGSERAPDPVNAPTSHGYRPESGPLLPSLPSDQAATLIEPFGRRACRGRRRRASAAYGNAPTRDRGGAGRGAKRRNRRPALAAWRRPVPDQTAEPLLSRVRSYFRLNLDFGCG